MYCMLVIGDCVKWDIKLYYTIPLKVWYFVLKPEFCD